MNSQSCPRSHPQESVAAAGSVLCAPCVRRAAQHLRVLPALHQECLHQAPPTGRRTNPTKVSGSRKRDHLDIAVLDARHNILTILESWSSLVAEKRGTTTPARSASLAGPVPDPAPGVARRPAPADDFADEIERLVGELRQTIDPDPHPLHALIRGCVVDGCPGTISALPQRGTGAGSGGGAGPGSGSGAASGAPRGTRGTWASGWGCAPSWNASERASAHDQATQPPARPHQGGRPRPGVSEATIRKWVSRGKITRYGAPHRRSEFDIEELTEIALHRRP